MAQKTAMPATLRKVADPRLSLVGVLPRDLLSTDVSEGTLTTQQLRARANATIFVARVVYLATFLSGKRSPFRRCKMSDNVGYATQQGPINHIAQTVFSFGTVRARSSQTRREARRVVL
ncbi:conserved hypothetical protein [Mesorhizobium ventifaucium]|uniref:Uncharacterized protein n=2 Tax=Mesorhizobium TaxID=68287 RepID=A0ABN8K5U9_9HYPH|nr:conserved hypothetical protein [Mesorhizobium escarrei]CAH2404928.1 conserved hypothetical protein [Mesorhizobium ventifaucium]